MESNIKYTFSEKVKSLKPSAIREIFKYAADPTVISLSAGNPAPDAFPVKAVEEISAKLLAQNPVSALQYGTTEGYTPLRNWITEYMKSKYNIGREFDNVIITSGAQQVMDLSTKTLCNEGDVIICEEPSFIGSLNVFRSYNCRLCPVPLENDGMNIEKLEQALKNEKNARFIYTIPNFQNPSGVTTSLEKRKQIYELAKKYNVLIIEDNPYGELRYSGESLPSIKSLDEDSLVIYAGSFSKVISPGMRVGWCVAPAEIVQKMVVCKQGQDVHTNMWSQIVCNEFVRNYNFEAHLDFLRELYRKKSRLAMDLCDKHLLPNIKYGEIDGGLFIWCTLPEDVNMFDFCKRAVQNKVCVVPGNAFLADDTGYSNGFRINFSTPTNEQLEKGIEILGNIPLK